MSDIKSLIYVPVLHTRKEAGEILDSLKGGDIKKHSGYFLEEQERSIQEMWDGIHKKIEETKIPYSLARIYQDALPVCGREREIVEGLAQKGSLNHQLILRLMKNGAKLEGTEDLDLLIKEHDDLSQLISKISISLKSYKDSMEDYKGKSLSLMKQRDAFIAQRIKSTLKEDEIPLVFMGVRHELEKLLQQDFVINYIIYRLPFKKVKDIYGV